MRHLELPTIDASNSTTRVPNVSTCACLFSVGGCAPAPCRRKQLRGGSARAAAYAWARAAAEGAQDRRRSGAREEQLRSEGSHLCRGRVGLLRMQIGAEPS